MLGFCFLKENLKTNNYNQNHKNNYNKRCHQPPSIKLQPLEMTKNITFQGPRAALCAEGRTEGPHKRTHKRRLRQESTSTFCMFFYLLQVGFVTVTVPHSGLLLIPPQGALNSANTRNRKRRLLPLPSRQGSLLSERSQRLPHEHRCSASQVLTTSAHPLFWQGEKRGEHNSIPLLQLIKNQGGTPPDSTPCLQAESLSPSLVKTLRT